MNQVLLRNFLNLGSNENVKIPCAENEGPRKEAIRENREKLESLDKFMKLSRYSQAEVMLLSSVYSITHIYKNNTNGGGRCDLSTTLARSSISPSYAKNLSRYKDASPDNI